MPISVVRSMIFGNCGQRGLHIYQLTQIGVILPELPGCHDVYFETRGSDAQQWKVTNQTNHGGLEPKFQSLDFSYY